MNSIKLYDTVALLESITTEQFMNVIILLCTQIMQ